MFPGAGADADDAAYTVLGAPLDATTSFQPGTRFGPRRLRHYATGFEDYDHHTGLHFSALGVHDAGDVPPRDDVAEYLDFLAGSLGDHAGVPLVLGGEHTVSLSGVRATDPEVFVTLDAHLDLRDSFAGTELSHATVTRRVLDHVDRAVVLGGRAGSEAGWERARAADVTVVAPEDVPAWEPPAEPLYLSVDVDAADPAYAPGTGTPEPGGLAPRELERVVRASAPGSVGFDVVEVTDRDDGQAATLGASLLRAFVYAHAD